MGNHADECEVCGEDLRGLSGGHAPGCPANAPWPRAADHGGLYGPHEPITVGAGTVMRMGAFAPHPDDEAVDRFAEAMKRKLAKKRREGRGGWDNKDGCSAEFLSWLLREHVEKGDPIDVANFAMMLHQRGERIVSDPAREEA